MHATTKLQITYLLMAIVTIALGLLSRIVYGIPLGVGDMLWAVMIYFLVSLLLVNTKKWYKLIIALLICYGVEVSQLYQAPWINQIRLTLPGKLILGSGFLWSDIIAYAMGVLLAFGVDGYFLND